MSKYPKEDDPPQHQPKPRKCGRELVLHTTQWSTAIVQRSTANSVTEKQSAAAPAVANDEESDEEDETRLKRPRKSPMAAQISTI
jgi:hypothetical protein